MDALHRRQCKFGRPAPNAPSRQSTPGAAPALARRAYFTAIAGGTPQLAQRGFLQKLICNGRLAPRKNAYSESCGIRAFGDAGGVIGDTKKTAPSVVELTGLYAESGPAFQQFSEGLGPRERLSFARCNQRVRSPQAQVPAGCRSARTHWSEWLWPASSPRLRWRHPGSPAPAPGAQTPRRCPRSCLSSHKRQ